MKKIFDKYLRENLKNAWISIKTFGKWVIVACATGCLGGVIGAVFHICIEYVTELRIENNWIMLFIIPAGLFIVWSYHICSMQDDSGTNHVIKSIRSDGIIPIFMAPLIIIGTILTHLVGGSAGREGAALQLGGSIGSKIGSLLHFNDKDKHMMVLCGMSGVFSALFGTPLTSVVFVLEVVSVGIFHYSAIVPCMASSLCAYGISLLFGTTPTHFNLASVPELSLLTVAQVVAIAAMCAVVSIFFCMSMHRTTRLMKDKIPNDFIRVAVGGAVIMLLTFIVQCYDYNGAGMNIIENAVLNGEAKPEAFLLKIIFTVITLAAGYKGGEIVPTLFIGATFGCFAGELIGFDPGFSAAVGIIAVFCGATNTPLASLIFSIELFGDKGVIFFAIASGVSYMLSGYTSLYSSQKIVYSKLTTQFIDIQAK